MFKKQILFDKKIGAAEKPLNISEYAHDESITKRMDHADSGDNNSNESAHIDISRDNSLAQLKAFEPADNLHETLLNLVEPKDLDAKTQPIAELKTEEIQIETEELAKNLNELEAIVTEEKQIEKLSKTPGEEISEIMSKGILSFAVSAMLTPEKELNEKEKEYLTPASDQLEKDLELGPSIQNLKDGYNSSPESNENKKESPQVSITESIQTKESNMTISLPTQDQQQKTPGINNEPEDSDLEAMERFKQYNAANIYAKIYNKQVKERRSEEQDRRLNEMLGEQKPENNEKKPLLIDPQNNIKDVALLSSTTIDSLKGARELPTDTSEFNSNRKPEGLHTQAEINREKGLSGPAR